MKCGGEVGLVPPMEGSRGRESWGVVEECGAGRRGCRGERAWGPPLVHVFGSRPELRDPSDSPGAEERWCPLPSRREYARKWGSRRVRCAPVHRPVYN